MKAKELTEFASKIKLDLSYVPEIENEQKFQDMSFDFSKEMPRLEIES